jgi:branched-chain amino acid transport system permease protein
MTEVLQATKSALLRLSPVGATLWIIRIGIIALLLWGVVGSIIANRYSAAQWGDFVVFGLAIGSIYALVALGYTMVYGVLRLINFCHGDIFMFGAFSAYFAAAPLARAGTLEEDPVLGLAAIFAVAMGISAGLALLVERVAYRPFRHVQSLAPLICAIGASFVIQQSARGLFGSTVKAYPEISWLQGDFSVLSWAVPKLQAIVFLAAVTVMLLLYLVVMRSKLGRAMRALAEDRDAAALMGIDIDRVIVFTFLLGGLTAGVAGVLYALIFTQVHFFMGFVPGIKAFCAAVLGGIGNIPGAMLGGLFLGTVESLGPALVLEGLNIPAPYQLRDAIAFVLLVLVLIFRPSGFLGERIQRRA